MHNIQWSTLDGNEAAAHVAYALSEVIAIYPITPASSMGELADEWAAAGKPNLWHSVPKVVEMQSEGGAAGVVHGALLSGALSTTFTASQGLLLMIPNMYKIAGELIPTVFHIAARSLATHALSIFGDHSDVMAARQTGWGMLFSTNVQEAQDMAAIAHAATLETRLPFLHILDGFRTSHEVSKMALLPPEVLPSLISVEALRAQRNRALSPEHPTLRGTAQNPDHFFQSREAANPFYASAAQTVLMVMEHFGRLTGRHYKPFDYVGHPEAERVVVLMGSGCETVEETVQHLVAQGEKVGLIKVRLYRPFWSEYFALALPRSTRRIAVLDRSKEPGAPGEALYQDVLAALAEHWEGAVPKVVGGRYGLSSKEFTPAMVKAVLDNLEQEFPKSHFTVGIKDDISQTSLDFDPSFDLEDPASVRAVFFALGADGTVSANKNSIKIIGEETPLHAQGYFVYDSKKSGSRTTSYLRFGPNPIHKPYLIRKANFVGIHQWGFLERYEMLDVAEEGATLLLNSPYPPEETWDRLPQPVQQTILSKKLIVYTINAVRIAKESGLPGRINTIMQTAFFALAKVLPQEEAIEKIKQGILKSYGKRGEAVVERNFRSVDMTLAELYPVPLPGQTNSTQTVLPPVSSDAPAFVTSVLGPIIAGQGDNLPVSAFPPDGCYPTATSRYEKRGIALEVPQWESDLCIQCGKCVLVCPHAVIRSKLVEASAVEAAPEGFKTAKSLWKEYPEQCYTLQVSPDDCTGCTLCVEVCPAKDKKEPRRKAINMVPRENVREQQNQHWSYFLNLPDNSHSALHFTNVKNVQLLQPLFEFSGACAGCGETPYLKLLSQLFGERAMIANATGCSSIYGANLPTTPWSTNREGRGPAWANSLFEDNAEFGLGMRLSLDKQAQYARELVHLMKDEIGVELVEALLAPTDEAAIAAQRERVNLLKQKLSASTTPQAKDLLAIADTLLPRSVWIVGGDGWAYDIGYGGLDHVLASGANVKLLVLDTEVYSNTGGQSSKSTPLGAVAKFAAQGKPRPKKDLAYMAMGYGDVYVANIAMGAGDGHTVKAFLEAESYPGPALLIAYSHCIAHGIDMAKGMEHQKLAEKSGHWPLFRYDPRRKAQGLNPFQLDSSPPKLGLKEYLYAENRYRVLLQAHPEEAQQMLTQAEAAVNERWQRLQQLAGTASNIPAEGGAV